MRVRLRPAYTPEQLAQVYQTPHDHTKWADHIIRVDATIALARWLGRDGLHSAADLSCGDGAILDALTAGTKYYGDYAPGYPITGPLEETLLDLPRVDLYVCSETIEHLDNPDTVLRQIRTRARLLVLSTPIGEDNDSNPEHFWGWDVEAVGEMLRHAGWRTQVQIDVKLPGYVYDFQLWGCS
jgi:hypothetical protein